MMRFVFDSNVFITLQRKQPIDLYPSIWNRIDQFMREGIVFSSREVYDEIVPGRDDLANWVKNRKEFFLPTNEIVQLLTRGILESYRGLVEGGKSANSADPFIIALAKRDGAIVVTEETRTRNMESPKIPDVCDEEGIECMDFITFLRKTNTRFS